MLFKIIMMENSNGRIAVKITIENIRKKVITM
jgi:hypothetical protein